MKTSTITPEDLIYLHNQGLLPEEWVKAYMKVYTINPIGDSQDAERINRERVVIHEFIFWATPLLMVAWLWFLALSPQGGNIIATWDLWAILIPMGLLVTIASYLRFVRFALVQPLHAYRFCEALTHACGYVRLAIDCFLKSPESLQIALLPFLRRDGEIRKPEPDTLAWLQMLGFFTKAF